MLAAVVALIEHSQDWMHQVTLTLRLAAAGIHTAIAVDKAIQYWNSRSGG